jgi:hypothetical protein
MLFAMSAPGHSSQGRSGWSFRGFQGTIESGFSDAHGPGHGTRGLTAFDKRPGVIDLRKSQSRTTAEVNPAFLRRLDSGLRALDDQAALELR